MFNEDNFELKKQKVWVSVIIAAYNAEKYIRQAIESVLIQNIPLEVIIINDASTDNTEKIIYEYLHLNFFKYIKNNTNIGVAKSRNKGIRMSQGEYIAFLDADDWWERDKLRYQVSKLLKNSSYKFCYTARTVYNESDKNYIQTLSVEATIDFKKLVKHNCVACSSVMLPSYIAKRYLMLHDDAHEDFLMWLRILKDGGEACGIDMPLLNYRKVENSKSANKVKSSYMTYKTYYYLTRSFWFASKYTISHLFHSIVIRIKEK